MSEIWKGEMTLFQNHLSFPPSFLAVGPVFPREFLWQFLLSIMVLTEQQITAEKGILNLQWLKMPL